MAPAELHDGYPVRAAMKPSMNDVNRSFTDISCPASLPAHLQKRFRSRHVAMTGRSLIGLAAVLFGLACGSQREEVAPPPSAVVNPGAAAADVASAERVTAPAAVNSADLPIAPDSVAERYLVNVRSLDSTISVDARYFGRNNFTGVPLPGYEANEVWLRREAAEALVRAHAEFLKNGYGLLLWDGYRPARATDAMVEWTQRVGRTDLVTDGYIADRSRHNLGLAIDLTLVRRATGMQLEMGTPFDTFTEAAHTTNASGTVEQNRQLLVRVLESHGFSNYANEWWHFSFNVPNPLRFDIPIR